MELLETWDPRVPPALPVSACNVYAHVNLPAFFEPIHEMIATLRGALSRSDFIAAVDCVSAFLGRHATRLSTDALQQLVRPHVVDLLCREGTRVAAAARLLVPLAGLVGQAHTCRYLVPMLVHHVYGYEKPFVERNRSEQPLQPPPAVRRLLRRHYGALFHVSFMRQLLRVMGLRGFLAVMPQVLVHALSGARDLPACEEERDSEPCSSWVGSGGAHSPPGGSDFGSVADMEEMAELEDYEEEEVRAVPVQC